MANEKGVGSKIVGIGLVVGAMAYIGYQLLKNMFKPEFQIWRCGNCHKVLPWKKPRCPFCGVSIRWPNPNHGDSDPDLEHYRKMQTSYVYTVLRIGTVLLFGSIGVGFTRFQGCIGAAILDFFTGLFWGFIFKDLLEIVTGERRGSH